MKKFEQKISPKEEDIITKDIPESLRQQDPAFEFIDKNLPKGYCLVGGAARSLAFGAIRGEVPRIRDIDIAYMAGEADLSIIDEVSAVFSPVDYSHGRGAQEIASAEEYMNTRDFTMNQVFYKDGQLVMSEQAIEDIRRGIIRPCEDRIDNRYESEWDDEWDYYENNTVYVKPKFAYKAALQKVVLSEYFPDMRIEESVVSDLDFYNSASAFWLAVALQKAFDWGPDIPHKFINELINHENFDTHNLEEYDFKGDGIYKLMKDLNEEYLYKPLEFRDGAKEYYDKTESDNLFDSLDDKYKYLEDYIDQKGSFKGNIKI